MSTAAKLYMKLTGKTQKEIKGESETAFFEGQIELDDWSWSIKAEKPTSARGGMAGMGSAPQQIMLPSATGPRLTGAAPMLAPGKTTEITPSIFEFSKLLDTSTTNLLAAMHKGELLEAEITLQEMSRDAFELKLFLSEVRVIDYTMSGKNDKSSGEVTETWEFNYSTIRFEFKPTARQEGKVSGVMTANAQRKPTASTESPATTTREILKLADAVEIKDWDSLLKALETKHQAALEAGRSATATATTSPKPANQ